MCLQEALLSRISPISVTCIVALLLSAPRRWLCHCRWIFWNTHRFRFGRVESFLLTIRMLALESTPNSFSFGFIVDATSRLISRSFSLSLKTCYAWPRVSAGHRFCLLVSSSVLSQISQRGDHLKQSTVGANRTPRTDVNTASTEHIALICHTLTRLGTDSSKLG